MLLLEELKLVECDVKEARGFFFTDFVSWGRVELGNLRLFVKIVFTSVTFSDLLLKCVCFLPPIFPKVLYLPFKYICQFLGT